MKDYHEFLAIRVKQPFSDYFVCKISSKILKDISFSLKAENHHGEVQGVQRTLNSNRLKEIGQFIDSDSASFPNPIILGANFSETGRASTEEERVLFDVKDKESDLYSIKVPFGSKSLSIIDGQHRLYGFDFAETEMELSCSIYADLAMPYQAFLFSTINYTQGKVDKSLAYQLFGYQLNSSKPEEWPPETLAVYFVRQLNEREPLKNKVQYRTADERSISRQQKKELPAWRFSTSSIVEAILSLISHNPKKDRYLMNTTSKNDEIVGRKVLEDDSRYPLRSAYIKGNDRTIEQVLDLALIGVDKVFWQNTDDDNFLKKTVGIACIFKFLKAVLLKDGVSKYTMMEKFVSYLEEIKKSQDFSDSDRFPSSTKGLNAAFKEMLELSALNIDK